MKTLGWMRSDLVSKSAVTLLLLATSFLCIGATWGLSSNCFVRVVDGASGKPLGTIESRTEHDGDTSFSWRLSDPLYPNGRTLLLETLSTSEAAEWDAASGVSLRVDQRASLEPAPFQKRESLEEVLGDEAESASVREYLIKTNDPGRPRKLLSALLRERVVTRSGRVYLRETWRTFEKPLTTLRCMNVIIEPRALTEGLSFRGFLKKYAAWKGETAYSRDRFGFELSGHEGLEP